MRDACRGALLSDIQLARIEVSGVFADADGTVGTTSPGANCNIIPPPPSRAQAAQEASRAFVRRRTDRNKQMLGAPSGQAG
eukprot:9597385-Alexandrium_andersonii.AAC.1